MRCLLFAVLLLTGCAKYNGVTYIDCSPELECEVWSGKEYDDINIAVTFPDGTSLSWKASNVRAFEGQRITSEQTKALIDAGVQITPAITEALTLGFIRGLKGGVP